MFKFVEIWNLDDKICRLEVPILLWSIFEWQVFLVLLPAWPPLWYLNRRSFPSNSNSFHFPPNYCWPFCLNKQKEFFWPEISQLFWFLIWCFLVASNTLEFPFKSFRIVLWNHCFLICIWLISWNNWNDFLDKLK